MARLGFIFMLLMALVFDARPASAEVFRVTPTLAEYFQLMLPGALSGRLQTPLILVMPDSSRVEQVISPFAGGSSDLNVDPLIDFLNGEQSLESTDTKIENERYQAAVAELVGDAPLRFPLIVLVRMETPSLESDPQIPTAGDEKLEAALRVWAGERVGDRSLLVIALQAR